jgi:hypothetical protein
MTLRLLQPMAAGVGGCTACCWHLNATQCPVSGERLKITRIRGLTPLPLATIHFKCRFNGGNIVSTGSNACSADAYVTPIHPTGLGAPYGFYIDVWGALAAGAWTSSVAIELFLATAGGSGTTITAVPESDTGLICATAAVSPETTTTDCLVTTADATVTITEDGGITIT